MNFKALNLFLSEDNIRRHIEHNNSVKLKLSILEKSVPKIIGCSICEIKQMKLDKDIKEEAARLIGYIRSHDLFFDSFVEHNNACGHKALWIEQLLYNIYTEALSLDFGFMYLFKDGRGGIKTSFSPNGEYIIENQKPILSLDLFEHTYYLDYGFKKDKFLKNALCHLDISRLLSNT